MCTVRQRFFRRGGHLADIAVSSDPPRAIEVVQRPTFIALEQPATSQSESSGPDVSEILQRVADALEKCAVELRTAATFLENPNKLPTR